MAIMCLLMRVPLALQSVLLFLDCLEYGNVVDTNTNLMRMSFVLHSQSELRRKRRN